MRNCDWQSKHSESGLYSRTPIFIIGMPRSGTTLVEQILSSHSDVYGAGELGDIASIIETLKSRTQHQQPDPHFLNDTTELDLLGFGLAYLKRLEELSNNKQRVVNKNPLNFKHIGLILLMFPNAKLVHIKRNPVDTCLSCYFQNFSNGQTYAFNLEHLAAFYTNYSKLMGHWQALYTDRIHSLSYEELITDQEAVTRELLEFCDLDWQNTCLNFHHTERHVKTASKYQVRKPLYTDSHEKWRHYEPYLPSVITELGMLSKQ